MPNIEVIDEQLWINGQAVSFPAPLDLIKRAFAGEPRRKVLKYNQTYTWDAMGVVAYSDDGDTVQSLLLDLAPGEFDFSPSVAFASSLRPDGEDVLRYRAEHPQALVPLFRGDRCKALVRGGLSIWFDLSDSTVQGMVLSGDAPPTAPAPPAPLDAQYSYLEPLVAQWVAEIRRLVPGDNEYNTLTSGVDATRIESQSVLGDGVRLPDELINFYKLVNVDYHPVTSAVLFAVGNYSFNLEAFEDLATAWQGIQLLCDGHVEADLLRGFSDRVQATGYANPAWIPFAHDYGGNYLLYDTDPSPSGRYGQIIELDNESWQRSVVADSLADLIEHNTLLLRRGEIASFDFVLGKR